MPQSWTEVCNLALTDLGDQRITSLDDLTKEASLSKLVYPACRDEVLRLHPWNSASRRAALPELAAAPAFGFDHQYQLPADCLRVLHLPDADADTVWKVEGRVLLTDLGAPLSVQYVARLDDPGEIDPLLVAAIAARIALRLCRPLTQSESLLEEMRRLFADRLRDARSADAQEGGGDRISAELFVDARR